MSNENYPADLGGESGDVTRPSVVDEIVGSLIEKDYQSVQWTYNQFAADLQYESRSDYWMAQNSSDHKKLQFIKRVQAIGVQEYLVLGRLKAIINSYTEDEPDSQFASEPAANIIPQRLMPVIAESQRNALGVFVDASIAYSDKLKDANTRFKSPGNSQLPGRHQFDGRISDVDLQVVMDKSRAIIGRDEAAFEEVCAQELDRLPRIFHLRMARLGREAHGQANANYKSLDFAGWYFRALNDPGVSDKLWLDGKMQQRYGGRPGSQNWRPILEGHIIEQIVDGLTDREVHLVYNYLAYAEIPDADRKIRNDYLEAMRTVSLHIVEEAAEYAPAAAQMHQFLERSKTPIRGHDYKQYGKNIIPDATFVALAGSVTRSINDYRALQDEELLSPLQTQSLRVLPEALDRLVEAVRISMEYSGSIEKLNDAQLSRFSELFTVYDILAQRREIDIQTKAARNVGNTALTRNTAASIGHVPEIRGSGQRYWKRWKRGSGVIS